MALHIYRWLKFGPGVGVIALAAVSLACSSNEDAGTIIDVRAENMRFVPDVIQIPAGQSVTLRLKNLDANEHDLEVRGLTPEITRGGGHGHGDVPAKALAVHTAAGKTASVTFRSDQKGTYEVICTIAGHEQSGMVARLIVV